jgi:hypothetical protein
VLHHIHADSTRPAILAVTPTFQFLSIRSLRLTTATELRHVGGDHIIELLALSQQSHRSCLSRTRYPLHLESSRPLPLLPRCRTSKIHTSLLSLALPQNHKGTSLLNLSQRRRMARGRAQTQVLRNVPALVRDRQS